MLAAEEIVCAFSKKEEKKKEHRRLKSEKTHGLSDSKIYIMMISPVVPSWTHHFEVISKFPPKQNHADLFTKSFVAFQNVDPQTRTHIFVYRSLSFVFVS